MSHGRPIRILPSNRLDLTYWREGNEARNRPGATISPVARVAANGAAPRGAQARPVIRRSAPSTAWGCSPTGPATGRIGR